MSFLSFDFALFVGLALLGFHLSPARWRPILLLGLSYVFYASWSLVDALLLGAVTIGVYLTGLRIESSRTEKGKCGWMALGVMTVLLLLFAFKSAGLLLELFQHSSVAAKVLIPLGLSYYVFKMVGYMLDVYWEVIPAQRNFVLLALYGSFFPQIVSGPIQRAESFFEQSKSIEHPDAQEFIVGMRRILFGLFKKIIIADQLGTLVEAVHANPAGFSPLELIVGAYCFAIQLYMDFSGITDIAIGLGLLFGVRGPENFNLPFYSANIQLYWRRWHMSLTIWLTDYLFTPLRMSFRRLGTTGLCMAIFINMIAIGLWHGVSWNFLVFGVMQGIFMTVSVLTIKSRNTFFQKHATLAEVRKFVAPLLTFHLVVFSLIVFHARSFSTAIKYVAGLLHQSQASTIPWLRFDLDMLGTSISVFLLCMAGFFVSEGAIWAARNRSCIDRYYAIPAFLRSGFYCVVAAAVLLSFKGTVAFIYARF